ncbi:unnamed protein product [Symbiodinium sp. KB8]|nr:unnamed protein product [Symbiodinium sp. KB8]
MSLGIWFLVDQCGRNFVLNGCTPTGDAFRKTAMVGSQRPTLFATAPPEGTLRRRAFGIGMTEVSSETLVQFVNTILAIAPAVACSFFLRVGKAGLDSSQGDFLGFKELTCQKKGRLQGPLLLFNLVSAVACLGQGPVDLTFPTMPFIIGFLMLSLLLAFRLTGAQSRASRAYDLWDDVLSICRSLLQFRDSLRRDHFMELARWIPAFPAALLCHVSSGLDLRTQLRQSRGPDHEAHEVPEIGGLTEAEIAEVMNRPAGISAPLFVVHRLAAISKKMDLSDTERMAMDAALSKLSNFVGSCEDVLPPSTPLGFATHTSRASWQFEDLAQPWSCCAEFACKDKDFCSCSWPFCPWLCKASLEPGPQRVTTGLRSGANTSNPCLAGQSRPAKIMTVFGEQIVAYIFLGIRAAFLLR